MNPPFSDDPIIATNEVLPAAIRALSMPPQRLLTRIRIPRAAICCVHRHRFAQSTGRVWKVPGDLSPAAGCWRGS